MPAATFDDEAGIHRLAVSQSTDGTLRLLLRAHRDIAEPTAGFHLFDRLGNLVFATGTWQQRASVPPMRAGDERAITFRVRFDLMALQRNIKALGTFGYQTTTRRNPVYIQYIPRTLQYARENLIKYERFARLRELLASAIIELR